MPTFDFTSPDGKTYSVQGPDGATPEQAFQILQQQLEPQTTDAPGSSLGGVAKSLGTGLAEGVIGLAGIPGDLAALNMRMAGRTPSPGLGSEDIKKRVEHYTGEFYKPQGTSEEIASRVGQFAPAVIGGPEALGAKLLTRVAAPALASEAAGKLTEGTAAKPWAEAGAALASVGGAAVAANKFKALAAARQGATATAPSAEQLLKTGGSQFDQARDLNVVVKPDFATNAAADMRQAIKSFDPEMHKPVFAAADRLENLGKSAPGLPPLAVEMNEIENIRKQLVRMKTSPDASVREAARQAIKSLQKSQMALTPAETLTGDAGLFRSLTTDAVENWAAGKRSNTVMGKANLGELNAATAGSGANEDNALRQAFKQLARPVNNDITPKWQRLGFNTDEGAAIEKVARGTAFGNTARYLGKLAPTGSVSGVLSGGAGFAAGGVPGAIALPAAGYIAKKIGDLSTKRAVAAVDSLVRSRSPLALHVASQLPPQIVQQLPPKTQKILRGLARNASLANKASQPIGQTHTHTNTNPATGTVNTTNIKIGP